MRRVSLNARRMQDAVTTGDIYAVLFEVTHPELEVPIRLSTDNTERLSSDPLMYGTRSTWHDANPITQPYLWVIASTLLPSDVDDAPSSGTLILENLDREMVRLLLSFTSLATIAMAVVLADTPDLIEMEYTDMQILSADIDTGEISLSFSREEIEQEYFPTGRMSRDRFPGLHL